MTNKTTSITKESEKIIEARELVNSITLQVMEHALGGLKCEHCKGLLKNVTSLPCCDKCGKHSEKLEKVNPYSDFVYCESCLECEI